MNILLLTTHLNIGGISSYTVSLAKEMSKKGHNVAIASSGGELVHELNDAGIRHFFININTKSILSYKIWISALQIKKLFKNFKPDIIHAQTRVAQFLANIISRMTGIPYIATCHGLYKPKFGRRIFGCWGKKIIAISSIVAQHLKKEFFIDEEKIELIYNGIDVEKFSKAPDDAEKNNLKTLLGLRNGFVVGSVSRLSAVKGHRFLIEAVKKLIREYPNLQLLIVGGGEEKENLKKLVRELGLQNYVVFAGSAAKPENFYQIMDVFAHPAYWQEPFGLSIVEAMAAGRPIVATRAGAASEIVKEGENAILVEPKNADEIARALKTLLASEDLRRSFGENSARLAKEKFSLEVMADKVLKVYGEALANARH